MRGKRGDQVQADESSPVASLRKSDSARDAL